MRAMVLILFLNGCYAAHGLDSESELYSDDGEIVAYVPVSDGDLSVPGDMFCALRAPFPEWCIQHPSLNTESEWSYLTNSDLGHTCLVCPQALGRFECGQSLFDDCLDWAVYDYENFKDNGMPLAAEWGPQPNCLYCKVLLGEDPSESL